jgi:hypothetical protein
MRSALLEAEGNRPDSSIRDSTRMTATQEFQLGIADAKTVW